MLRILVSALILCMAHSSRCQQFRIQQTSVDLPAGQRVAVYAGMSFNGLTLRIPDAQLPATIYAGTDPDHLQITGTDEHFKPTDETQLSLILFSRQTDSVFLFSTNQLKNVRCIFQYTEPAEVFSSPNVRRGNGCIPPPIIPQSVWRTGLPAPVPGRSATPTEHCIIHHSAAGNGDTNYAQQVRSYYIQHTQVNGWDDIGYNYLVAANGLVFAGRDPEKAGILQDNVLGAHFCGKNNNTMGVCMIGEFSSAQPSWSAMYSLRALLAWKLEKDGLDPFGKYPHPNAQSPDLGVIAGHRDGCSTECPGNNLYALLPSFRNELRNTLDNCAKTSIEQLFSSIKVYPNPNNGSFFIKGLKDSDSPEITDVAGKSIPAQFYRDADGNTQVLITQPGLYFLRCNSGQTRITVY